MINAKVIISINRNNVMKLIIQANLFAIQLKVNIACMIL